MRKGVCFLLLLMTLQFIWLPLAAQVSPASDSLLTANDTVGIASHSGNPNEDNGVALNIGMPTGAMQPAIRNNMFNLGFGLSILAAYNPFKKSSILRLGGEIGYTYYGRFKSGGLKTSYGIGHLAPVIRLRPDIASPLVPFFDIFAGGDFYISDTKEDLDALATIAGIESYDFGST